VTPFWDTAGKAAKQRLKFYALYDASQLEKEYRHLSASN
jgi:hypothetical protein